MSIKTLIYGDDREAMVRRAEELRTRTHDVYLRSLNGWLGDVENVGSVIIIGSGDTADRLRAAYGDLVRDPDLSDDTKDPALSKDSAVRENAARHTPVNIGIVEDRNALLVQQGLKPSTDPAVGTPQEQAVEQVKKAGPDVASASIVKSEELNAAVIEQTQLANPAEPTAAAPASGSDGAATETVKPAEPLQSDTPAKAPTPAPAKK